MQKVRAKFVVDSVETRVGSQTVKMSAVYGGSTNAEDNTFASATPTASVSMTITNPDAFGIFVPGTKFYADFAPAT